MIWDTSGGDVVHFDFRNFMAFPPGVSRILSSTNKMLSSGGKCHPIPQVEPGAEISPDLLRDPDFGENKPKVSDERPFFRLYRE
jgi:hypothetical protein